MDGYTSEKRIIYNQPNILQQQPVGAIQNQTVLYKQQQYATSVMISSLPQNGGTIIVNQAVPPVIISSHNYLGTSPVSITCPLCKKSITTNVETSCNCATCLLCWITGFILFACIQCCSGKEIGCCDAIHKCPNCSNIIGTYSSC